MWKIIVYWGAAGEKRTLFKSMAELKKYIAKEVLCTDHSCPLPSGFRVKRLTRDHGAAPALHHSDRDDL